MVAPVEMEEARAMPFENCVARVYTVASVWQNAPPSSGIFGLSNARGWLFVGETDDIRGSLLELLEDSASAPLSAGATGFSYELRGPGDRARRHSQLSLELRPAHVRVQVQVGSRGRN